MLKLQRHYHKIIYPKGDVTVRCDSLLSTEKKKRNPAEFLICPLMLLAGLMSASMAFPGEAVLLL